jgi:hypothetical protein
VSQSHLNFTRSAQLEFAFGHDLNCRVIKMTKEKNELKLLSNVRSNEIPKVKIKDAFPQMIASCAMNFVVIQAGINMAFSSILIPQLSAAESDIKIDLDGASNIASIVTVSVACGALICGPLLDKFGRVRLATLICVPFFIAWLLIAFSTNLFMIYAARIISGFCGGSLKG